MTGKARWTALLLAVALVGDPRDAAAQEGGAPAVQAPAWAAGGRWLTGSHPEPAGTREYALFVPDRLPPAGQRPLVLFLHGCTQDPDDLAKGTRMNRLAAARGALVLYPRQPSTSHPQRCWNWYTPAQVSRDQGEASILAGMVRAIAAQQGADPARITVAGISAGGAMAANLAVAYPELFAALAVHSGIAALGASNVGEALMAMRQGIADTDALAQRAHAAMGSRARPIPLIAVHGAQDAVVVPANTAALVAQFRRLAQLAGGAADIEAHVVPGLGHAWSGGSKDGTFADPAGPDAAAMVLGFLLAHPMPRP